MFLTGIKRNEVDFLASANDQCTGNVPLGVGKFLCIDWNSLPVGREFDGKFLKNVKSPPHALPPPRRL